MSGLLLGILLARTFSGLIAEVAGWRTVYVVAGGGGGDPGRRAEPPAPR